MLRLAMAFGTTRRQRRFRIRDQAVAAPHQGMAPGAHARLITLAFLE